MISDWKAFLNSYTPATELRLIHETAPMRNKARETREANEKQNISEENYQKFKKARFNIFSEVPAAKAAEEGEKV